jgi:ferredoxin-NADP reductase
MLMSSLYKVLDVEHLSPHVFRLRTERPAVSIRAGQCFSVGPKGLGVNREYSMYSGAEDPYLDFLIRRIEHGVVSTALQNVRVGDAVEIGGPYGEFCLPESVLNNRYLFVATGTGIAPFHSYVKTFPGLDYRILHGIRLRNETYHAAHYESGRYLACVSRSNGIGSGERVTDRLAREGVAGNEKIYLCGNRAMIVDVVEILRAKGVSGDNIFMEVFF